MSIHSKDITFKNLNFGQEPTFRAILLLKMAKTQILKRHIFRLDRYISKLFSVF